MYKEKILKISKPISTVETESTIPSLEEQVSTQTQETELPEQLEEFELESIDIAEPAFMRFTNTNSSGWKASDILREVRLDSFDMGSID